VCKKLCIKPWLGLPPSLDLPPHPWFYPSLLGLHKNIPKVFPQTLWSGANAPLETYQQGGNSPLRTIDSGRRNIKMHRTSHGKEYNTYRTFSHVFFFLFPHNRLQELIITHCFSTIRELLSAHEHFQCIYNSLQTSTFTSNTVLCSTKSFIK